MAWLERWLVDDQGEFWRWGDLRLGRQLQTNSDPNTLWPFCIRNLGFVGLDRSHPRLRLRLRPAKVSATAIAGLLFWLFDHPPETTVLSLWDDGWQDEIIGGSDRLMRRLYALQVSAAEPVGTWFDRRAVDPATLDTSHPIRELICLWKAAALGSEAQAADVCDRLFGGTFTIVRRNFEHAHIITQQGLGYRIYDRSYLRTAIGTRIEDDPNVEYGRWVAQGLCEAVREQRPLVEDVNAALVGPSGRRRVSYRRILLPLGDRCGSPAVITASRLNTFAPLHRKLA